MNVLALLMLYSMLQGVAGAHWVYNCEKEVEIKCPDLHFIRISDIWFGWWTGKKSCDWTTRACNVTLREENRTLFNSFIKACNDKPWCDVPKIPPEYCGRRGSSSHANVMVIVNYTCEHEREKTTKPVNTHPLSTPTKGPVMTSTNRPEVPSSTTTTPTRSTASPNVTITTTTTATTTTTLGPDLATSPRTVSMVTQSTDSTVAPRTAPRIKRGVLVAAAVSCSVFVAVALVVVLIVWFLRKGKKSPQTPDVSNSVSNGTYFGDVIIPPTRPIPSAPSESRDEYSEITGYDECNPYTIDAKPEVPGCKSAYETIPIDENRLPIDNDTIIVDNPYYTETQDQCEMERYDEVNYGTIITDNAQYISADDVNKVQTSNGTELCDDCNDDTTITDNANYTSIGAH